ncbi:MAG: hypothetical protein MPW15_09420 [Candidatus Manganitrophus sp.]|nr:hypothetical protein [Candidatus Manganitrophus sp.]
MKPAFGRRSIVWKRRLAKVDKELEPVERKFQDQNIMTKAPKEVIAKLETQRADLQAKREKLNEDLRRFREMILGSPGSE